MKQIEISIKNALGTVDRQTIDALAPEAEKSLSKLTDGTGAGNDFLGWVELPTRTPASLLDDIT